VFEFAGLNEPAMAAFFHVNSSLVAGQYLAATTTPKSLS
jgi:hypothetical protein